MSDVISADTAGQPVTIEQRADVNSFLGLSLKNGLLNIVTLTLYRFWGKTEVRRRVWRTTYLNDEPFEYTGRGIELFVGFLLALLAIALPFLGFVFGSQLLGPWGLLLLLGLYLFLFLLIGFGQFTAFRYMASRTSWRGVRFRLRGSALGYAWAFLGYVLLAVITAGWFWPAAARRLAGRLWGGLEFGNRRFRFDIERARQRTVYDAYLVSWVLTIVAYVVFGAVVTAIGISPDPEVAPTLAQFAQLYLALGVFFLVWSAIYAFYRAAALESVAHGLGFEGAQFRLVVSWRDMALLSVTNILLLVISLGFLMPFVQARSARFLVERLDIRGEADLDVIRQAADAGPRHGEGLADAFGLSPI